MEPAETLAPAQHVAAQWGWDHPTDRVLKIAQLTLDIGRDEGKALTRLELLEAPAVVRIKAALPAGVDLLEYAAQESPAKVQPNVEKVRALTNGFPYYEQLQELAPHPGMDVPAVVRKCEELDCALMLIEASRPVIVFATFKAMMQYRMSGRADRAEDPLLAACGDAKLNLAVGSRDDISAILARAGGKHEGLAEQSVNVWHSASQETKQYPEQRELARLLDHAIQEQASDIALIPNRDNSYSVLIRKWGALSEPRTAATWQPQLASSVIEVLQTKSGANPTNTTYRTPRDGHISYRSPVGDAFLRLSFIPLNHLGEIKTKPSVSIRLFSYSESKIELAKLGLQPEVEQAIDDAVRMPQGLILVAGPMNSGKSTTIAGAIGRHLDIFGATRKRVSVEDPIERFVGGVTQINVPAVMIKGDGKRVDDNARFNEILRGLKRHDINTFWIGEVRDAETAEFCANTSVSGHLVLSTIHAKDSILAYDILSKMIRPDLRFQLAEAMALVVSQRLVPALCDRCKKIVKVTAEEQRQWANYMELIGEEHDLPPRLAHATPHHESQCEHCESGYSGYAVVSEVLPFTRDVRNAAAELIEAGGRNVEARARMADGRRLTLVKCAVRHLATHTVDMPSVIYL